MKAMIGYGWYQKPDMVKWAIDGIVENFPDDTHVEFYFEAEDGSDREEYVKHIPLGADTHFHASGAPEHILEHGVHRHFIDLFMKSACDVLIVPQDDNRFQRPLLPDLQLLWDKYGTNLGWISGRDGYGLGYSNMMCSPFSDSNSAKTALPIGAYREVLMMNTGPVVYFRHVIERVGLPEPDMPWFWWDFFALKCKHAGLTNILLSMDALHTKFGRVGNNPALFDDKLVADCLRRFNERWSPVYGRNPL